MAENGFKMVEMAKLILKKIPNHYTQRRLSNIILKTFVPILFL